MAWLSVASNNKWKIAQKKLLYGYIWFKGIDQRHFNVNSVKVEAFIN